MIKKILDFVETVLKLLVGFLMVEMVVVVFVQVVLRYGFHNSTNWADEVARYSMIWVVFLACPIGYRRHSHIRIDVVTRYLPAKVQKVLELAMYILQLVFLGVVLYAVTEYIPGIQNQQSISLRLNMQYIHLGTAIGVVLMIIFILERMFYDIILPAFQKTGKEAAK